MINLDTLTKIIAYINDVGYDCWIEGVGNGDVKIIIQERYLTLTAPTTLRDICESAGIPWNDETSKASDWVNQKYKEGEKKYG
jgi:hypothetical protein